MGKFQKVCFIFLSISMHNSPIDNPKNEPYKHPLGPLEIYYKTYFVLDSRNGKLNHKIYFIMVHRNLFIQEERLNLLTF